jgi:hypothetical protein
MKRYPSIPSVSDAPDDALTGHLWLLELVDGRHLRFRMEPSGLLRFGDRDTVHDDPEGLPDAYRHAVRHVRERFDRDALRDAVEDVTDVTFFGVATHRRAVDYDWKRLPSFLGHDVWSDDAGAFRPPDATERIFEALGLDPVNAVEREVHARDFDPEGDAVPESAWYDGPAAGVVVRAKAGGRAVIRHPEVPADHGPDPEPGPDPIDVTVTEFVGAYATEERLARFAAAIEERGEPLTVDALTERAFEGVLRVHHRQLDPGDDGPSPVGVRTALRDRSRTFLADRHED